MIQEVMVRNLSLELPNQPEASRYFTQSLMTNAGIAGLKIMTRLLPYPYQLISLS
jgi:hypothetical protein